MRVLFVDDELHVLDGLRDLLRRQRREWEMVFALGGEAALREIDLQRFDVVVSDMRMPDIDGATLLGLVQERHPETVRIVLSGQTELAATLRTVPVAHQYLAKPCDRDQLRRAIDRACVSRAVLADEAVRRAAGGAAAIPSAPALYTKLVEATANHDTSVADIGALVESDIAMCARVLQLVNSSFFGLGRRISSAREAVTYLGMAPLRALVLTAGAFRAFTPDRPIEGFSVEELETHSARVARLGAELLPDRRDAEDALTAGMLHDLGKLLLAAHRPDELALLLAAARESGRPLHTLEHDRNGVTHAEIGAYLLALWGLPHPIVEAVAHHHAPHRLGTEKLDPPAAVHIADMLITEQEQIARSGASEALDEDYLNRLGVAGRLPAWRALAAGHTHG
ncbi:MAG: HDOD domain-containing protein [Solirubrobacteraceae bacterium]